MLGLMTKDFIITFFTWGHFNRGLFALGILWLLHQKFFTYGLFRFGLFPRSPVFPPSSFFPPFFHLTIEWQKTRMDGSIFFFRTWFRIFGSDQRRRKISRPSFQSQRDLWTVKMGTFVLMLLPVTHFLSFSLFLSLAHKHMHKHI